MFNVFTDNDDVRAKAKESVPKACDLARGDRTPFAQTFEFRSTPARSPFAARGRAIFFGDTVAQSSDRDRGVRGYGPVRSNASSISIFCSSSWLACEPVAGLALSARATQESGKRLCRSTGKRAFMKYQAPMFRGSSCTQTSCVPSL